MYSENGPQKGPSKGFVCEHCGGIDKHRPGCVYLKQPTSAGRSISAHLDKLASHLEAIGMVKEAEELDIVSNTLDATDTDTDTDFLSLDSPLPIAPGTTGKYPGKPGESRKVNPLLRSKALGPSFQAIEPGGAAVKIPKQPGSL